jgi:LemA protein
MTGGQWTLLGVVAVLVFWMVGAYNRLVNLRHAIVAGWVQIDEQLRRRSSAVTALVEAMRPHLPDGQATFDAAIGAEEQLQAMATAVRAKPTRAAALHNFVTAEGVHASAMARLVGMVDPHASLRDDAAVATALSELRDVDVRLGLTRHHFNTAVDSYNEAVWQFPARLLARLFAFEPAERV